ncbi:hypothetical protein Tco_1540400, partial [Tanacetum coccineum]
MRANSHHKPQLVAAVALRKGVATAAAVGDTKIINADSFTIEREDHTSGNISLVDLLSFPIVSTDSVVRCDPGLKVSATVATITNDEPRLESTSEGSVNRYSTVEHVLVVYRLYTMAISMTSIRVQ